LSFRRNPAIRFSIQSQFFILFTNTSFEDVKIPLFGRGGENSKNF